MNEYVNQTINYEFGVNSLIGENRFVQQQKKKILPVVGKLMMRLEIDRNL